MKNKDIGIWQGRFQYIHNGHVFVFQEVLLKRFNKKFITIVNPSSSIPARTDYARFDHRYNPFSYFHRMLLWKIISDASGEVVNIVPCWHAKYKIALENEFFPNGEDRYWIVPVQQDDVDQQDKARALRAQGEGVYEAVFDSGEQVGADISSSKVRALIEKNDDSYRNYIPSCICDLTMSIQKKADPNLYLCIPFLGDNIDLYSLQYAINKKLTSEQKAYLVFVISVKVAGKQKWVDEREENTPWWFENAVHDDDERLTYYIKSQIIHRLMDNIGITDYLITPIFIMNNNVMTLGDYSKTFLPPKNNTKWIINNNIKGFYLYNFIPYLINNNSKKIDINNQDIDLDKRIVSFFEAENDVVYRYNIINKNIEVAISIFMAYKNKISKFLVINKDTTSKFEKECCEKFNNVPDQISNIIDRLKRNEISETEASQRFETIKEFCEKELGNI